MSRRDRRGKPALERVREALSVFGMEDRVVELPSSTHTAQEAAQQVGVSLGQIAKSLVFLGAGEPILVIASGANRVSQEKLRDRLGLETRRADADEVRQATGFAIGGVPPLGHSSRLRTLIDEDLMAYQDIYAAAGTPKAVFRLSPQELLRITGGELMDLREEPERGSERRGGKEHGLQQDPA